MYLKALAIIIFAAAIAMALVTLRHQRLEMMNEMTRLHSQMNRSRQGVWDYQVRIAGKSDPIALAQAIQRAKLNLEPMTPGSNAAPVGIQVTSVSVPRVTEVNGKTVITNAKAGPVAPVATEIPVHSLDD